MKNQNYLQTIKTELGRIKENLTSLNARLEALDKAVEGYSLQAEASTPFPVELAPETAIFIEDIEALKAGEADSLTANSISRAFTEEQLNYFYQKEQEELYNMYYL